MDGTPFEDWDITPREIPEIPPIPEGLQWEPTEGKFDRLVERWEVDGVEGSVFQQIRFDPNEDGHFDQGIHLNIDTGHEWHGFLNQPEHTMLHNDHIPLGYDKPEESPYFEERPDIDGSMMFEDLPDYSDYEY